MSLNYKNYLANLKCLSFFLMIFSSTAGFAAPSASPTSPAEKGQLVDGILASVNNEIVTRSDLVRAKAKFEKNVVVDDLLLFGRTPADIAKDQKLLLEYLIDETLVDSEIKRLNLAVTIERVEQELRDIARRNNMTRADLSQAIKTQGSSISEYQDYLKMRLERQNLIVQEVTSKIRVTEDDILAAYTRKYPKQDTGSFEYTLAHIQFNHKKGGPEGAKARAQKALDRMKAGESFEALAEQITEDASYSPGGVLGSFKVGEMTKDFEKAVASLSPGETSGLVNGKASFHILKVLTKKLISDPFFEKQKETLKNQLFDETFQKHFKSWIEQKKEEAFIRINLT